MSSEPAAFRPPLGAGERREEPRRVRDLWAIDERDALVRHASTGIGRLVLVFVFSVAAMLAEVHLLPVAVAAAFAYLPRCRNWIALGAALAALALNLDGKVAVEGIRAVLLREGLGDRSALAWAGTATVVWLACACGVLALVRRRKGLLIARRPLPVLLGTMAVLCALASAPWLGSAARAAVWSFLVVFAAFVWFLAYALVDQRSRAPAALPFQVGILHPFWGSSATPFGKGAAFLRKHQAKDDVELAITQLKALKLLVWALLLMLAAEILEELVEVRLGIPEPPVLYRAHLSGESHPLPAMWGSLVWAALGGTLTLAIWGHTIVAVARLAGFRLPRNTWRPLQSRSLAEFWNRYYYYFKELMVEFFGNRPASCCSSIGASVCRTSASRPPAGAKPSNWPASARCAKPCTTDHTASSAFHCRGASGFVAGTLKRSRTACSSVSKAARPLTCSASSFCRPARNIRPKRPG